MRFIPLQSKPISLLAAALFGIGFTAACSPSANNDGSGGTHGSGGSSSSSGGSKGSGGTTGSGGSTTTGSGGSTTSTGGKVGSGGTTSTGSGGSTTTGTGGKGSGGSSTGSGGSTTGSGGSMTTGSGGSMTTGTGGSMTTGTGGSMTGSGGAAGSSGSGGQGGSIAGCMNTDMSTINIDSSGFICNNQWGIKGAWYCYSSDTSSPCNPTGVIPYNSTSKGMCLKGTIAAGGYDGLGFKVNSGPPGDTSTPGKWDASKLVGFAITVAPGSSNKGSDGSVLYVEYPTTTDVLTMGPAKGDAPGVTVPGVAGTPITYNVLFADSVLANNDMDRNLVDPQNLTDVKLSVPSDSKSHSYDFCITKVVPLMTAPSPVVAAGAYGPSFTNNLPQAVNGINGYAVQTTPFDKNNGLPMSMQVSATATGVGFTYTAGSVLGGNAPSSYPAVISGWGPGVGGIQLYGSYQADKQISSLQSVITNWTFMMGANGDAAYDVWFGPAKAPKTAPAVELMVWIGNAGNKSPIGNTTGTPVMGSDGVSRTPHYGMMNPTTGQQVVSYVPSGSSNMTTNLDLAPYFKDAAMHGYGTLMSSYYLLGVQAGFEVYSADTWKTISYDITIK